MVSGFRRAWGGGLLNSWTRTDLACLGRPAVADLLGQAAVACQGADHEYWLMTQTGGRWGAPVSLGGRLASGPGLAQSTDGPVFYARGTNLMLYTRTLTTPWQRLGGILASGPQAAPM